MIYYTATDGTIIGGTAGADLTGITALPHGADYAICVDDSTTSTLNPNNAPGTYTMTNISPGPMYTVPTATGTLTFAALSAAQQLSDAQTAKTQELHNALWGTLLSSFTSKTNGHTYLTDANSQAMLSQAVKRLELDTSTTTETYYTTDAGWIDHTLTDLHNVFIDGGKWKDAQFAQYRSLISQVKAATTPSAVQEIVWSAATY